MKTKDTYSYTLGSLEQTKRSGCSSGLDVSDAVSYGVRAHELVKVKIEQQHREDVIATIKRHFPFPVFRYDEQEERIFYYAPDGREFCLSGILRSELEPDSIVSTLSSHLPGGFRLCYQEPLHCEGCDKRQMCPGRSALWILTLVSCLRMVRLHRGYVLNGVFTEMDDLDKWLCLENEI